MAAIEAGARILPDDIPNGRLCILAPDDLCYSL